MGHQNERERKKVIIRAEIDRCRQKHENAQIYYAYGSRSAGRTMDKYSTLATALEFYLENKDGSDERMDRLLKIGEALRRAEKQIELYGEKSLSVRQVIAEVNKIAGGGLR